MNIQLCNLCAAKVKLGFPRHELKRIGDRMDRMICGHCQKKQYCIEYEMAPMGHGEEATP